MLKSAITCENINGLSTWDDANCEGVLFSCKANITNNGCMSKECADYTTKFDGITGVATHEDC